MTSIKKTLSVATVLATISGFAYATSASDYAKLPGKNWLGYGGDAGQMRYHPSDGINVKNAANLKVKWIHQHGENLVLTKQLRLLKTALCITQLLTAMCLQ